MRIAFVIGFACACNGAPATFPCTTSAQCVDGARQGVCEPIGYCSFPDPTCPSHSRFDPSAGGGLAGMCLDGGTADTPTSTCLERWMAGTVRFGAAQALALDSPMMDRDPFETYDELTLYFSSDRNGNVDIYSSTRASKTDSYSATVTHEFPFSTPGYDSKMSITSDGLYATVTSTRAGGMGLDDVWQTTRASTSTGFSALSQTDFEQVNTPGAELDARISVNGLHVYLAPRTDPVQNLAVAARARVSDQFGMPVTITELSTGMEADPSPSLDERILVFTSLRTAPFMGTNLWYATRASATATFEAPLLVPDLDTDEDDGDPHLSPDGCTLYFARAPIGMPSYDIYVAKVQ